MNKYIASKSKTKGEYNREYQKKRSSVEKASHKQARLKKSNDYKKKMQSDETDSETQSRLLTLNINIKGVHKKRKIRTKLTMKQNKTLIRLTHSEPIKRRHT